MTISEIRVDPVVWYSGLSSDPKPVKVEPFARLIETDTGDVYRFSGTVWQRIEAGGAAVPISEAATWSLTTTADNAAATVTKAGEAGKSHYIVGAAGSFSAAVAGKLMTLKDGATVLGNLHVHDQRTISFTKPVKITAGAAAELSLAASGTATLLGAVMLYGYTR